MSPWLERLNQLRLERENLEVTLALLDAGITSLEQHCEEMGLNSEIEVE